MKKLINLCIILVVLVISTSCGSNNTTQGEKQVTQGKSQFEPDVSGDVYSSYWFVLSQTRDGSQRVNSFISQPHSYFSYAEFKEEFNNNFLLNLVQVSKATYDHNNDD